MLRVTLKAEGFKKAAYALGNLNLNEIVAPIIEEMAFATERYAKQVTPVDTGRLRSSIGVSRGFGLNKLRAFVQPNTNYAVYVHDGTRRMRARPFMKWGTDFMLQKFTKNDIGWRLDKELRQKLIRL